MAVLVQEFINGTVSGCMYTGIEGMTVIEACEGLGELHVSGGTTPARYILNPELDLIDEKPAAQRVAKFVDGKGIISEREVLNQNILQPYESFELGMIGREIQNRFRNH